MIKRTPRLVAVILASAILAAGPMSSPSRGDERPDVLFVMLDDSGWTDFGVYGSEIETPNIDALARSGIRFTDCHAAAPNCSPSRAGMLTGRIPSRVGVYSYIPPNHPMHLVDSEVTVAELLKTAGYATGHFGKWHLSQLLDQAQPQPGDQGFDHSLGTTNNAVPSHLNPNNFVRNGKALGRVQGYSCQIVADEACTWLQNLDAEQRFFACVWFHEPHSKIASPPELIAKYRAKYPEISKKQASYYANIENVDLAVGRLKNQLKELGREENTFLFLTSDNGGVNPWSNQGLRGKKSFVYEGGQREPGILRWPAKVKQGSVNDTLISHLDLLPTVCEACDVSLPDNLKLDGVSLIPLLSSEPIRRRQPLFWFFYRVEPAAALRQGNWVLLGYLDDPIEKHTHPLTSPDMPMIKNALLDRFELYNLKDDLPQEHDLSSDYPQRAATMRAAMVKLHKEVVADGPTWDLSNWNR